MICQLRQREVRDERRHQHAESDPLELPVPTAAAAVTAVGDGVLT